MHCNRIYNESFNKRSKIILTDAEKESLQNYYNEIQLMYNMTDTDSLREAPIETGHILSVKDGIVTASGLPNIKAGELLFFPTQNIYGMALNLELTKVGIVIFGNDFELKQNDEIQSTGKLLSIEVGPGMTGRV